MYFSLVKKRGRLSLSLFLFPLWAVCVCVSSRLSGAAQAALLTRQYHTSWRFMFRNPKMKYDKLAYGLYLQLFSLKVQVCACVTSIIYSLKGTYYTHFELYNFYCGTPLCDKWSVFMKHFPSLDDHSKRFTVQFYYSPIKQHTLIQWIYVLSPSHITQALPAQRLKRKSWLATYQKVGCLISVSPIQHAKVLLGKILKPKLPLNIQTDELILCRS